MKLKECKSGYNRDTCIPMFIPALFIIAKIWKQHRHPTTDNGSRECGVYTYIYTYIHNEVLLSHKEE
jgi:hypothetical protein